MMSFAARAWMCRDRRMALGPRTLIMGIVNVTPDSFYGACACPDPEDALQHALRLIEEGADVLDIGGESSRPGAEPVSEEEEIRRIEPVIAALRDQTDTVIAVDTTKARVARVALEAGAHIVNDISALRHDREMADVVREFEAGLILMHRQGTPRTMQDHPTYTDVIGDVSAFLATRAAAAVASGISRERIVLDPGIGFGKTFDHNWALLAGLPLLVGQGYPVLAGLSRKRFLGAVCGREVGDRLPASLAALTCAILRGASIIRVHDVKESCDAARVADRMSVEDIRHGDVGATASST